MSGLIDQGSGILLCIRVEGARREKLEAKATAAALRSAAAQAELLVEEVAAQKGTLADTPTQWRARLRGIASIDDLISALRDLETQLNVLGDGLPKGARQPSFSKKDAPQAGFAKQCLIELLCTRLHSTAA
jgi:hypothetical protein